MNGKIKKVLKVFFTIVIIGITYSFFFTTYETIKVNKDITKFKNRAILDETQTIIRIIDNKEVEFQRNYYIVPRETSFEKDGKNVFRDDEKDTFGQKGDIFVTRQSPFPQIPVFHQFMSYYFGGHAAIYDGEKGYIEATGYPEKGESLLKLMFMRGKNKDHGYSPVATLNRHEYWTEFDSTEKDFNGYYRTEYIGLRIKNADDQIIDTFVNKAQEKVDDNRLYNFLFFLNMRYKYYCTDLVSRSYEEAYNIVEKGKDDYQSKGYAKKMNDDGFITSVNDLILSRDTYISFYVEIIEKNGVTHENYYYLEDVS